MASLLPTRWNPEWSSGMPRAAREGCDYDAYVPDTLADREFSLNSNATADVADAELAVSALNARTTALIDTEAAARLLLRAEAVASSRIEGLQIGGRRLLRAQLARETDPDAADFNADEILNNIDAMRWAVDTLVARPAITVDDLLEIHRRLLRGTDLARHGGRIRTEQNWIGGNGFNPCRAAFVPPPHEHVRLLLEDLCAFMAQDRLPAVAQAAIAHAQFETIHPFIDGNGRTGRVLVHVVLRRRGLAPRVVTPVSLVLATWAADYVDGLTATRYLGSADSPDAVAGLNQWIALFATACRRAVEDSNLHEDRVREFQRTWRAALGGVRRNSATDLILAVLPGSPVITVKSAASLTGRSVQAVNTALPRLLDAGILRQTTVGRRNRAFEAPALIESFSALERRMASPDADTAASPPSRPVPPPASAR